MEWIYKIRSAIPDRYIKYTIYLVMAMIFVTLVGKATEAQADEFYDMDLFTGYEEADEPMTSYEIDVPISSGATSIHESPYSIDNSQHSFENSPLLD